MEDPQKDTSPAQPVEAGPDSASQAAPPSESPATPAHEEADRASGQTDEPEPEPTNEDQGDDPEADNLPGAGEDVSAESVEADPNDTHGANDHPEG